MLKIYKYLVNFEINIIYFNELEIKMIIFVIIVVEIMEYFGMVLIIKEFIMRILYNNYNYS